MNRPSLEKDMQAPNGSPTLDVGFVSLTRSLVDSDRPNPVCPECGDDIDFSIEVEWMGPSAFVCNSCEEVIELHRVEGL